jgi:hypothetical protein
MINNINIYHFVDLNMITYSVFGKKAVKRFYKKPKINSINPLIKIINNDEVKIIDNGYVHIFVNYKHDFDIETVNG